MGFGGAFQKMRRSLTMFALPVYTQTAAFFSDEPVRPSAPGVEDGKLPIGIKRH
jgi:hypothetical protein